MSEIKIKKIVENELSFLDKAIDYANNQIRGRDHHHQNIDPSFNEKAHKNLAEINSGQEEAYKEFLRVAWGKAIRINSEIKGEVVYRLSQASAVFPISPSLNVATPASSLGRLVSIARAGDTDESRVLGEYTIEDVWYFERFIAHEYLENIKNFKKMTSEGKIKFSINNLSSWLKNFREPLSAIKDTVQQDEEIEEGIVSPWERVSFDAGIAEAEAEAEIISEEPEQQGISLSTRFYVNLSAQQYDTAHAGPHGLVYVFGVAGSGKTSVALGRAKALSQLGQRPSTDELYNADFPEDSQIGIVRTGELISYLKDTCNMLSLHRLPIVEYREVYEELKMRWNIEQSRNNIPKYFLVTNSNADSLESTMGWFYFISETMLRVFSEQILESLNRDLGNRDQATDIKNFDGDVFLKINQILTQEISDPLRNKNPIEYLFRIDNFINKFIEEIFNKKVWVGIPDENNYNSWLIDGYHDIAAHLISNNKVLCLFGSAYDVKIIIPQSEKNRWKKWIPDHAVFSLESSNDIPNHIKVTTENGNTIEIKLMMASENEIIQYAKNGKLRFYKGVGEKTRTVRTRQLVLAHMPRIIESNEYREGAEKNARDWRARVRSSILNKIRQSFNNLKSADLFSKSIQYLANYCIDGGIYSALIRSKELQLSSNKISEKDIDLLIGFIASITRGIKANSPVVANNIKLTPYRSSVFIDEVQDFSEVQVFLLSMLSSPKYNSVTVVGDLAQCLSSKASDIKMSFPELMWNNAKRQELIENIRQKNVPTINALGAAFRSKFIDNVIIRTEEFNKNENLQIFDAADSIDQLRLAYKLVSKIARSETIVIVVPSIEYAKDVIEKLKPHLKEKHRECGYSKTIDLSKRYVAHVTTPKNIKGLEFDHVIALYLDKYNLAILNERNTLYVIMSRPKKTLTLVANFKNIKYELSELISRFADIQK